MKHIVVVDDDTAVLYAITSIFDTEQYQITVYGNGSNIMKNDAPIPDLYILDRQLSGVDGLDICRHVKNQSVSSHVPVIILSANPNIANLASEAGADIFIEKPFSIAQLRARVAEFVQ